MKGLDWFRVMTDIAWDGDLEHVSDAEFRTYFELIAISAYHLTDGVLMRRDCLKHLNTRRPADTLRALSEHGYIALDADTIIIPNYAKYQQTREEVIAEREKNRDRVRRYRAITNDGVTEQSKSKRESKSEIPPIVPQGGDEYLVFQYWAQVMRHPKAKWDNGRRTKIRARLEEGFSVDDLKQAIDGCKSSPHHMGENETYTVYDSIDLIFRNASNTERFMGLAQSSIDPELVLAFEQNKRRGAVR